MHSRVNLINTLFEGDGRSRLGQIQKIISTHQYICLQLRLPGKTHYLYLGRGSGHEGMWDEELRPPAPLRVRDRFVEYLRKHLSGHYIAGIQLDPCDRILTIPYGKQEARSILFLFYKGRDLYLAHANSHIEEGYKLFFSWKKIDNPIVTTNSESEVLSIIREEFNEIGRLTDIKTPESVELDLNEIRDHFNKLRGGEVQKLTSRKKKFLKRKQKKIEQDLERIAKWEGLKLEVERPGFSFGDEYKMTVAGIDFKFPGELNHFKKMNIVYSKIKALKKGQSILKARLVECAAAIIKGSGTETTQSYKIPEKLCSPIWSEKKQRKEPLTKGSSSGVVELSFGEIKAAVGTSAAGNDYIRSKWGAKNDIWFHIEGERSSHLVIKVDSIAQLNEEQLEIIGSIIRDYGQLTFEQIPLIYTQVKNLKGVKGTPGMVIHKKAKYRTVCYRSNWKEIISSD